MLGFKSIYVNKKVSMVFRKASDQIKFLQYVQRPRDVAGLQQNSAKSAQ